MLGQRFGPALPLSAGMAVTSVGALILSAWHGEPWEILLAMLLVGIGIALAFSAMAALIAENVRPTETRVATGMNTVMRTVGAVIGGQLGAALLGQPRTRRPRRPRRFRRRSIRKARTSQRWRERPRRGSSA